MTTAPVYSSANLSSNRSSALKSNTLQLVLFYDGSGRAVFSFETVDAAGNLTWTTVKDIPKFDTQILTAEYRIEGSTPTGNFVVQYATPDGMVDGLAFGLFWRDARGVYHILRSNSAQTGTVANFVSAWPLGMGSTVFATRAPQVTDGYAQETALAVISGARLLPNGKYSLTVY